MLTIRLRRHGAKKDPHYRVVVTEDSDGRDGPFLEIVGHYHPRKQPAEIVLDVGRAEHWIGQGAQMSDTVRSLYKRVKAGNVEGAVAAAEAPEPARPRAAAQEAEAPAADESTEESSGDSEDGGGEEE